MFFFLPTYDKPAIKNNPRIQLHSIFHETVNRNKKPKNFRLNSFSAIQKTVSGVEGSSEGNYFHFYHYFRLYT